jgi:hypothetical protein
MCELLLALRTLGMHAAAPDDSVAHKVGVERMGEIRGGGGG